MSRPLRSTNVPRTHFADPGDMRRWLAGAAAKDEMIYAAGADLGRGDNPAAALARAWSDRGVVELFRKRGDEAGRWNYYARRLPDLPTVVAVPDDVPTRPKLPDDPAWSESVDGRVFRLIARFAASGRPCPSNQTIAELLDLDGHESARYRFNRLIAQGHLRLIEGNRFGSRVVEIAATGKRTSSVVDRANAAGRVMPPVSGGQS